MGLSIGNYEANLTIEGFRGVMQYDENESINTDMRYAADANNVICRDGNLEPMVAPKTVETMEPVSVSAFKEFDGYSFYNLPVINSFNGMNADSSVLALLVADFDMNYHLYLGSASQGFSEYDFPSGGGLQPTLSPVAFFSYESGGEPQLDRANEQWLYISTGDGFLVRVKDWPDAVATFQLPSDNGLNFFALYGERMWSASDVGDTLYYSRPYDPTDWTANATIPEDGGGEIRVVSADAEPITGIFVFGQSLLIFKEHHIYQLTGMSPDEYNIREVHASAGTVFANSVVIYNGAVYFMISNGLHAFDGYTVRPVGTGALRQLWRDTLPPHIEDYKSVVRQYVRAFIWDNKYVLVYPTLYVGTHDSTYIYGDKTFRDRNLVIYDFQTGVWSKSDSYNNLVGLQRINGVPIALSAQYTFPPRGDLTTSPTLAFKLQRYFEYFDEPAYIPSDISTHVKPDVCLGFDWVSPWSDLGCKDVLKTDFKLRFWLQTRVNLSGAAVVTSNEKLKLSITLETERGSKTRELVFDKDVDQEIKMNFHLSGRKVRMRIKVRNGDNEIEMPCWCKIMGGMQLGADVAQD